jgi:hypothetical protein
MQAPYQVPTSVREPGTEGRAHAWLHFLRSADAMYQRVAEVPGEPYQSPEDQELATAAQLAATLGVELAEAAACLPIWCVRRSNPRIAAPGATSRTLKSGESYHPWSDADESDDRRATGSSGIGKDPTEQLAA